jgi:DNA polymerase I-like protein with 3'-5' exonuclease and polymerase domains
MVLLCQELPDYVKLEHQVAEILTQQELHGWYFDERNAYELENQLRRELDRLANDLRSLHPFVSGGPFTPKRANRTSGYVEGCEFTRIKDLNPTSRDHIAWVMQTFYKWKPTEFTEKGKPTIDEVVLNDIGTPIALKFFRCLELTKQLGLLSEGVNAWLKLVKDNRIHHHCSVATNTHRCAHRKPNLGQVPSDAAFRKLFCASPDLCMVGADLAGIELRMLAHYLARYDGGRYADVLLNGDIHQENADKIGISRRLVKTVTYAFLYGAGDQKIGLSYDQGLSKDQAIKKGREIRQAYMDAIPGLEKLVNATKAAAKRGYIRSIDGRHIGVESGHKALNYLLQSSAGVIAKRWMVIANNHIKTNSISAHQLAFIHDELQFETEPSNVDVLKGILLYSAQSAGEYYNMRCPVSADAKSGSNWAEVH